MSHDVTFVVFGPDWGRHVSTVEHLFRELVPTHRVVWVNSIGHRVPTLSARDVRRAWPKVKAMVSGASASGVGMRDAHVDGLEDGHGAAGMRPTTVIAPRVLPFHANAMAQRFNAWSLTRDITSALAGVRSSAATGARGPVVVVTTLITAQAVLGRCGESASVYLCQDDFLAYPGLGADMLAPLELKLLGKVDAVVATADILVRTKRAATGRGFHLPQGSDYAHFARARAIPPDLASLPRPIIGFAGTSGAAVDVEAMRAVANRVPGGSVVMVGRVVREMPELRALANVHMLGARTYAELPAYVQAFDVALVPYVSNAYTAAVDPLKLLEYLAAGVPVVTTPIPEARKYADVVRIAADERATSFADAVVAELALATDDRDAGARRGHRQRVARSHSWARRAERFLEIVDEVLDARRRADVIACA